MNRKWLRRFRQSGRYGSVGFIAIVFALALTYVSVNSRGQNAPAAPAEKAAPAPGTPQAAPANPPQGAPDQGPETTPFKIVVPLFYVTTPVTVFDSTGQYVYDLDKDEFKIYDNGQIQDIYDFDNEVRALSLVVIVETNDTTAPFLDSVRPLGSLFSDLVMGPQGEVALLTYSDRVGTPLDFTQNGDKLDTALRGLQGRGSGMHLEDALTLALSKLMSRPLENRKVIIIFSEGFDLGSKMRRSEIVKGAMNSNITIYGMGFSPVKGLWKRPAEDPKPDLVSESVARSMPPNSAPTPTNAQNTWEPNDIPIMSILLGLGEEAKKPLFKSSLIFFSNYSGGRYYQKWGKDTVQQALNQIATEIHSQYELVYKPQQPIAAGYHAIRVEVRRPGAKVRAKSGWYYQGEVPRGVRVK